MTEEKLADVISILNASKLKPVVNYLTDHQRQLSIQELHDNISDEVFKEIVRSRTVDEFRGVAIGE